MPFPPEHSFLFWYLLDPQTFFLSLAWYIYSCTPNSWQFLYFYSNSGISRSHNVCHLSPSASRSHCINVHTFLGLALVLNPLSLESPPETMSVSIQTYIWPLASNHFLHILSQFLLVLDSKDACIFLHVLFFQLSTVIVGFNVNIFESPELGAWLEELSWLPSLTWDEPL